MIKVRIFLQDATTRPPLLHRFTVLPRALQQVYLVTLKPYFKTFVGNMTLISAFPQGSAVRRKQNTARFKGSYKLPAEVQICRILAIRAIFGHIFHTNRKKRFMGFSLLP